MKSSAKLVIALTLVCMLSSLVLAFVNDLTEERIAEQKRLVMLRAVSKTFDNGGIIYDNDPSVDVIRIDEWRDNEGAPKQIFPGKKDGKVVGLAFSSTSMGYIGDITVMIGVDPAGEIAGIEVLDHSETPGLGANIESPKLFRNQFKGKSQKGSPSGKLEVVRRNKAANNWEIEALTGATISSRAVVKSVNDGLTMFNKYKEEILSKAALKVTEGGTTESEQ